MSTGGLRVMVPEPSATIYEPMVHAVDPDVVIVAVRQDGTLALADGTTIEAEGSKIEVAWGTTDFFYQQTQREAFLEVINTLDSVRWFQSPSAGFDMGFFADIIRSPVLYTRSDVHSVPIAEYIVRAALDHRQQAWRWREAQRERRWDHHEWDEVCGTTWVIVGLGSIGGEVALRAQALGARVIGVRRRPMPDGPVERMVTPDQLASVLPEADIVALCAPANPSTHRLVDEAFLAAMKPTALLVNIARGSLVDHDALLRALDAGQLGAAVLDVMDPEPPPPDSRLWDHPKITLSAHNSGFSSSRSYRQAELFCANLGRYLRGEPLRNVVSPADLD